MKYKSLLTLPALITSSVIAQDMGAILEHPGLEIWRQPDHLGMSCMNCHGALPTDIVVMQVPDDHIFVRDIFHVDEEASETLIDFIDTVRTELPNLKKVDRFSFRPFQPGGEVLAEGQSIAARDRAFFDYLVEEDILLASGDLESQRDAVEAVEQTIGISLFDLKVGLEFPKISSDFHFGEEHKSLNEWIPLHAVQPRTAADKAEWHALQDAYILDPSNENFWNMYLFGYNFKTGGRLTAAPFEGFENDSSASKPKGFIKNQYGSMLILQHAFLLEALGEPIEDFIGNSGVPLVESADLDIYNDFKERSHFVPNPFWAVGHGSGKDGSPKWLYRNIPAFKNNMGEFPKGKVPDEISRAEIGASWFWLGWMFDAGVNRIDKSNSSKSMEYFNATLRTYYNVHLMFAAFTKNIFLHRLADTDPREREFQVRLTTEGRINFLTDEYKRHVSNDPAYAEGFMRMMKNGYNVHMGAVKDALRLEPHKTYKASTLDLRFERLRKDINNVNNASGKTAFDMVSVDRKLERLKRLNAELVALK